MRIYLIKGVNSLHLFIWQVTVVCFTFWRCVWSGVRSRQPDGESTGLGIGQFCPTIRAGRSWGIWGTHQGPHLSPPMCSCVCVYAKAKQTYGLFSAWWRLWALKTWIFAVQLHIRADLVPTAAAAARGNLSCPLRLVSQKTLRALRTSFQVPPLLQPR